MNTTGKPIKIGILDFESIQQAVEGDGSSVRSLNPTKKFTEAVKAQGHIPVVYRVEKCQMFFGKRGSSILYNNKPIKGCDVLIPRLDFSVNIELETSIIKQFQLMGIPLVNKYLPIARAKNKLRTLQVLTKYKIPVPKTMIVRKIDYLDDVIKKIGGYPVVIKAPFGSYGKEVAMLESRRSLTSALDIMWKQNRTSIILIQEYVHEADDSDLRVFVVGDKIVAAMKRTARAGDFRSNLQLGGVASNVKPTVEEEKMAIKATKVLGLDVCGVDILRSRSGSMVMEMNANPGISGITKVTGVDVAAEMVKYAAKMVKNNTAKK